MAIERATSDEDDDLFDEIDASESGSVDEVPTIGHLKINRQRELLKYFRLVVHDFPHLEQFRQAYNPPPASSLLRFRSVHYQGDAKPVTRKSVLTVDVAELFASEHFAKLSNAQMRKFLHLAGTHWIPGDEYRGSDLVKEVYREDGAYSDVPAPAVGHIKISCERFPHENQNIKWCSDVFDALLAEVKVSRRNRWMWVQPPASIVLTSLSLGRLNRRNRTPSHSNPSTSAPSTRAKPSACTAVAPSVYPSLTGHRNGERHGSSSSSGTRQRGSGGSERTKRPLPGDSAVRARVRVKRGLAVLSSSSSSRGNESSGRCVFCHIHTFANDHDRMQEEKKTLRGARVVPLLYHLGRGSVLSSDDTVGREDDCDDGDAEEDPNASVLWVQTRV